MSTQDYTIVEKYQQNKNHSIAVKVFFDPNRDNMGLQNYGMTLFEGVFHDEQLACLEINGIKRYLTGLNEFAPEVKNLPKEEREAKVKEIRSVVSQLEKDLAANMIEPEDPEFWNKVKLLKPDNDKFWDKISLRCGNDPVYLDPTKDPYDLIKLYAIEAGGFSIVAKNLNSAKNSAVPPKFYLDKLETTVGTRTELTKVKNKALAFLTDLYDSNPTKLLYVAKVVDANSSQYTKSTPNDVIYESMDLFINGVGTENNKRRAAQSFLNAAQEEMETLKLRALVKDATYYKFITNKSDGFIYNMHGVKLGKTPEDVVEFLRNPLNEEFLSPLMSEVEYYWNM